MNSKPSSVNKSPKMDSPRVQMSARGRQASRLVLLLMLTELRLLCSNGRCCLEMGLLVRFQVSSRGKGQYMFALNRDQMEVDRKLGSFGWGCS